MKRIYHHYLKWEDFHSGMIKLIPLQKSEELIEAARSILANETKTKAAMQHVIDEWPISCEVNLSYTGLNRQAWLGQACCWLIAGVQENLTKLAWHRLTLYEQIKANEIADQVIASWEKMHG